MSAGLPNEEWRPVAGYPHYKVSNRGRVMSCHPRWKTPREMRFRINAYGYLVTNLQDESGVTRPSLLVHRLVAEAFIGPRAEGMDTRHLDGDKTNNAASNLAYGTRSENELDKVRHGAHHEALKTHCPQDHPYDEENTRVYRGSRVCRACERARGVVKNQARRRGGVAA